MRGLSVLRSIHMIVYYSIFNSSPYLLFHFLVRYTSFWLLIRSICDVIRRWSESGNNVTAASSSSKLMPFDKSFICQWEGTHFWLTSRDSKVFGVWSLGLALASAQPSAPVPHNRTLAGSPVMRVHPSGTDWRQERRPQHLQTSSHCMYGYNIVSKITIRPHFFWKGERSTTTIRTP